MKKTVEEALLALANDPAGVYQTLKDAGVKGYLGNSTRCPIATWLDKMCGEDPERRVLPTYVHVSDRSIFLPDSIRKFINRFDGGNFYRDRRI